jgi:hypothetical protein
MNKAPSPFTLLSLVLSCERLRYAAHTLYLGVVFSLDLAPIRGVPRQRLEPSLTSRRRDDFWKKEVAAWTLVGDDLSGVACIFLRFM